MNFFAHAVLAAEAGRSPSFVLGAMLPDFVGMIGVRLGPVQSPELRDGMAHHEEVDRVFHGAPLFLQHMSAVSNRLCAQGLGAGAGEAVGHVGVELLLDGWLFSMGYQTAPFQEALAQLDDDSAMSGLNHVGRLQLLRDRLLQVPLPGAYREPTFVAQALTRILANYPTLRFADAQRPLVVQALTEAKLALEPHVRPLLAEIRRRL